MNEARWIQLRAPEDESAHDSEKRGVHFFSSPYNAPTAMRAYFAGDDVLVLEFKYIAPEETVCDDVGDGVVICKGKNSGRIYALNAELKDRIPAHAYQRLRTAVAKLAHRVGVPSGAGSNYEATQRALETAGQRVLEAAL
jgi:hypothetical protein